jgi:hypothetical protein
MESRSLSMLMAAAVRTSSVCVETFLAGPLTERSQGWNTFYIYSHF